MYYRQESEFDIYYSADLNTSKDLEPKYWQKHYGMCRKAFDHVCAKF